MSLRRYFSILVHRLPLFLLLVPLGILGAYLLGSRITPRYQSQTDVLVGRIDQSSDANSFNTAFQIAQSHALLVKQQPVLEAAAEATQYPGGWQELFFAVTSDTSGGQVVEISVIDTDPGRAKQLADELAHQLIVQSPINAQQVRSEEQRTFIQKQLTQLTERIQKAETSEKDLETRLQLETDPQVLNDLNTQLDSVQTKIDNWQKSFTDLSSLAATDSGSYLSILAPAQVPTTPISPNIPLYMIIGGLLGLLLAGGLVVVLEYLDETIKDAGDAQRELDLPTLGTITKVSGINNPQDRVVTLKHPRSAVSEAYRVLRTNLRFSGIENPTGALLVTSSIPGEGKTTTATNLAVTLAQGGKNVVLLDCDLRRPSVHELFGFNNDVGLSSLFLEDAPLVEQILKPTDVDGLRVLTSGPMPPNPAEMLDSRRMTNILKQLRDQSDMVIIDSPPALAVADASIIGSRCSGAVLVVDSGKTRNDMARRAAATLRQANVKLVGVVINKLNSSHSSPYYYKNYTYYYNSKPAEPTPGNKTQ